MPSVSPDLCSDFSAAPGTGVNWIDLPPSGCTIEPVPGSPWPFTAGPPIVLPSPSNPPATLKTGLKPGPYYFKPSCCAKPIRITVT